MFMNLAYAWRGARPTLSAAELEAVARLMGMLRRRSRFIKANDDGAGTVGIIIRWRE